MELFSKSSDLGDFLKVAVQQGIFALPRQKGFSKNRRQTERHQACLNARGAKEESEAKIPRGRSGEARNPEENYINRSEATLKAVFAVVFAARELLLSFVLIQKKVTKEKIKNSDLTRNSSF